MIVHPQSSTNHFAEPHQGNVALPPSFRQTVYHMTAPLFWILSMSIMKLAALMLYGTQRLHTVWITLFPPQQRSTRIVSQTLQQSTRPLRSSSLSRPLPPPTSRTDMGWLGALICMGLAVAVWRDPSSGSWFLTRDSSSPSLLPWTIKSPCSFPFLQQWNNNQTTNIISTWNESVVKLRSSSPSEYLLSPELSAAQTLHIVPHRSAPTADQNLHSRDTNASSRHRLEQHPKHQQASYHRTPTTSPFVQQSYSRSSFTRTTPTLGTDAPTFAQQLHQVAVQVSTTVESLQDYEYIQEHPSDIQQHHQQQSPRLPTQSTNSIKGHDSLQSQQQVSSTDPLHQQWKFWWWNRRVSKTSHSSGQTVDPHSKQQRRRPLARAWTVVRQTIGMRWQRWNTARRKRRSKVLS